MIGAIFMVDEATVPEFFTAIRPVAYKPLLLAVLLRGFPLHHHVNPKLQYLMPDHHRQSGHPLPHPQGRMEGRRNAGLLGRHPRHPLGPP